MGSRSIVEALRHRPPAGSIVPEVSLALVGHVFFRGEVITYWTLRAADALEDVQAMASVEGSMSWSRPEQARP